MKTKLRTALLIVGALAGIVVLLFILWFRPNTDVSAELQEVFPSTESASQVTSEATTEASNAVSSVAVAGLVRYDAQPIGSKTKIEGTSTIHDWSMESAIIGGFMEVDVNFPVSALTDAKAAKPKVEVFMPVRSFKSYTKKMDEVMMEPEQMDEQKQKRIQYKLIELRPKSAAGSTGAIQFDAVGALTIKGSTRTNTMPVTIEKQGAKLKVTGRTTLKMTDYGVKPPAPTFLPIKTGDDITITFEWLTAQKAQ